MGPRQLLIATDLDGTLLDHHDYGLQPARPILQRLQAAAIPFVLNTSKTRAELETLRQAIGLDGPFLVENGSALYLPPGVLGDAPIPALAGTSLRRKVFGVAYQQVLDVLGQLRAEYRFAGFSEWTPQEIAEFTGLSESQAVLAKQREFSEPILFADDNRALAAFIEALKENGLRAAQGGRFLHVMGRTDKGQGLRLLREWYAAAGGQAPLLIALGDSANDRAMLECADIAVRVRAADREPPELDTRARTITTERYGPFGWAEALAPLLDEFGYPASI